MEALATGTFLFAIWFSQTFHFLLNAYKVSASGLPAESNVNLTAEDKVDQGLTSRLLVLEFLTKT